MQAAFCGMYYVDIMVLTFLLFLLCVVFIGTEGLVLLRRRLSVRRGETGEATFVFNSAKDCKLFCKFPIGFQYFVGHTRFIYNEPPPRCNTFIN